MSKITCLIEEYHSTDPWDSNRSIDLREGQSKEVSEEKAAQLVADFPESFKVEQPRKQRASKGQ